MTEEFLETETLEWEKNASSSFYPPLHILQISLRTGFEDINELSGKEFLQTNILSPSHETPHTAFIPQTITSMPGTRRVVLIREN
jgi:hypothetical protein